MPRADGGDDLLQQTGARLRPVVAVILVLVVIRSGTNVAKSQVTTATLLALVGFAVRNADGYAGGSSGLVKE